MTEPHSNLRRLMRRHEFLRVANKGRRTASAGLVLQAWKNPEATDIGFGLTASRKVGKAVTRNRARRRLRALAREILPDCATPGYDYVLIARSTTPSRPWPQLREDLLHGLKRLKLLRE